MDSAISEKSGIAQEISAISQKNLEDMLYRGVRFLIRSACSSPKVLRLQPDLFVKEALKLKTNCLLPYVILADIRNCLSLFM